MRMDYKLLSLCYQVVMRLYPIQPSLNAVYSVFLRNRMEIWTSIRVPCDIEEEETGQT